MEAPLLLATTEGFWVATPQSDGWHPSPRGLEGHHLTSVIAREGVILAGTTKGIFFSDDLGQSWQGASEGLVHRHIRWLAFHPDISDRELAGTEPAAIYLSNDGAASWQGRPEVEVLREAHGWFLPYSPEAGCVRDFAFHGARAYAAVEVGGLLRSDDCGATWRLVGGSTGEPALAAPPPPRLPADIHSVAIHPASPDRLFAATHAGLYRSRDGGEEWERCFDECYCRALWLDPADPDHIIFGPATTRGWHGSIVESRDGGTRWHEMAGEVDRPFPSGTLVERFTSLEGALLALLSSGELLHTRLDAPRWASILPGLPPVSAATVMHP